MKVYVALENWEEDYETHGTNILGVFDSFIKAVEVHPDSVSIWDLNSQNKEDEVWPDEKRWRKEMENK